ncbi:hypothetical protein SAMN06265371_1021 [Lutibacter agarilyticus]|uniref:MetA-pathway of phenol degradation n=1 Tax=Lutibacter agarilyticus TaxID=1109740 RepID=A0A238VRL7_9FLAO|nr:hypothetical protein [Lutibacter agarilyticus]SNR36980.1 hypothetical protein SAMN06265371_1021 [Lutibacter agarilyticus]
MVSKKENISNFNYFLFHFKSINIFLVLLLISNSVIGQEKAINETVEIPEPLMFDLVRGLGAKQGELEINALADFPLNDTSIRGVDWAPEIEYALFDNFAIELEFPFNNFELEAYKMAVQWTIGSSKNNKYIHGIQVIGEKYIHDAIFELNLLYVPAYRFNEIWSAIGLFGVMLEYGDDTPKKNHTIILNASLFANLNKHTVVGLEINNSDPTFQRIDDNSMELLLLPQVHYEFDSGFAFQFGIGPKFNEDNTDLSAVLRVIKSF